MGNTPYWPKTSRGSAESPQPTAKQLKQRKRRDSWAFSEEADLKDHPHYQGPATRPRPPALFTWKRAFCLMIGMTVLLCLGASLTWTGKETLNRRRLPKEPWEIKSGIMLKQSKRKGTMEERFFKFYSDGRMIYNVGDRLGKQKGDVADMLQQITDVEETKNAEDVQNTLLVTTPARVWRFEVPFRDSKYLVDWDYKCMRDFFQNCQKALPPGWTPVKMNGVVTHYTYQTGGTSIRRPIPKKFDGEGNGVA